MMNTEITEQNCAIPRDANLDSLCSPLFSVCSVSIAFDLEGTLWVMR